LKIESFLVTMFGRHLAINKSSKTPVSDSLILAHRIGCNSIQICLGDMKKISSLISLKPEDIINTLNIKRKYNKYIVVHGKYIYNFCHPDKTIYQQTLLKELVQANKIQCDVIIHQGKNVNKYPQKLAIKIFVDNIKNVIAQMSQLGLENKILLENASGQGTEIGYKLDELQLIWEQFTEHERKYLGFCIDTCHIFAAGELDIRDTDQVKQWFRDFDERIGVSNIKVVHLNDSKVDFGQKVDRHESLGKGKIGLNGLEFFSKMCHLKSIPLIMETPNDDIMGEIEMVKCWTSDH
jgi:deoxyribonuclease-4